MGIRARLTIGMAVLLLAGFALLGAVVVQTTQAALVDQVDTRIWAAKSRMGPHDDSPERGGPRDDVGGRGNSQDGERGQRGPDGQDAPHSAAATEENKPSGSPDDPNTLVIQVTPSPPPGVTGTNESTYERPIARLVYAPDGELLDADPSGYPDAPDPLPVLPALSGSALAGIEGRIVTLHDADSALAYRALAERRQDGTIVVTAAPLSDVEDTIAHVVRAVALAALGTLGLAALVSWWLIRAGLRPVDRMIDTAAAIAGGDLSRRVPDADPRTELGQLGTALNEMLGQIERSTAARVASEERMRRFVADAAHELRTPLTSLQGHAELYRQGALATPEAIARAMSRIESSTGRMARLVEDLLLLARLDQQRTLEREPVDLAALAREAAADFAAVAPDRPFEQQLEDETVVLGDRIRLRQMIDNLLANAWTHTPTATPVRLSVRRRGQDAELVVADEGPGIPPQAQERVFERFWRADPGRTRQRGGTGLGLAIVASIVAAHGGTVALASTPGRGTIFTVRLPLATPGRSSSRPDLVTADYASPG
ncbi:MAG: histidine kinase [Thermomicrobiales bacterium]|nr:histidine kinase [Thermomicrobiales bacterium]